MEQDNFSDQEFIDVDELVNDLTTEAELSNSSENNSQSVRLPNVVVEFLKSWHKLFLTNNIYVLQRYYGDDLNRIFNKFFAKQWPTPQDISSIVENDQIFIILYSECYHRHIYSRNTSPSLDVRTSSFNNYCNLFNLILNNQEGPVGFELPNNWLWDIVDEFIYQFNEFQIYKAKLNNKTKKSDDDLLELDYLIQNQDVWSTYSCLNALYSLAGKSNTVEQLKAAKQGKQITKEITGDYGFLSLYKNLGYFSIIGLLRIHTLLGDYALALKTIEHIELSKKASFTKIPSCHFTTYYYVGFCFLMMNRYLDAIKSFQHILLFFTRTKNLQNNKPSFDITTKKSEQMFALLTICISLCPTRLDEKLNLQFREKFGDQLLKLTRSDDEKIILDTYEELFRFGSPRFIDSSVNVGVHSDPLSKHWKIFKLTLLKNLRVPNLKSYLNLYSSLELTKLLKLMDLSSVEELNELLLAFKLSNRQLKSATKQDDLEKNEASQSLLQGASNTIYDIDIKVDDDHVNVLNFKNSRLFGLWFVRNWYKNYSVIDSVNSLDIKKEDVKVK